MKMNKLATKIYFVLRSHLREIRDRSVLRLFESNEVATAPQILSGSPQGITQGLPQQGGHWDQDPVNSSNNIDISIFSNIFFLFLFHSY